jgi:hypothetical protein
MDEDVGALRDFQSDREPDLEYDEKSISSDDWFYPRKSLDEVIARSGKPLMTFEQFVQEWEGVFPPEYWDTVLRIVDER